MRKLALVWSAHFADKAIIHQFDDTEQTKEHTFQEVLDRQDHLTFFSLTNSKLSRVYQVDLRLGQFQFFDRELTEPIEDVVAGCADHKYRLIYFRRVAKTFSHGADLKLNETCDNIKYFLGFQTTINGKNIKHIAQISEDGAIYLT